VIIVSDTTPLSELAKVGQLNLLRDIFGKVIIPQEVYKDSQDE
jgi:predicted nucleic acid-binding protein